MNKKTKLIRFMLTKTKTFSKTRFLLCVRKARYVSWIVRQEIKEKEAGH